MWKYSVVFCNKIKTELFLKMLLGSIKQKLMRDAITFEKEVCNVDGCKLPKVEFTGFYRGMNYTFMAKGSDDFYGHINAKHMLLILKTIIFPDVHLFKFSAEQLANARSMIHHRVWLCDQATASDGANNVIIDINATNHEVLFDRPPMTLCVYYYGQTPMRVYFGMRPRASYNDRLFVYDIAYATKDRLMDLFMAIVYHYRFLCHISSQE